MPSYTNVNIEEKEKAIKLLRDQMEVEGKLVGLYEKSHKEIGNLPVRHLLHMIQLDSQKHIDICQTAIEILQGEDVLSEEKQDLLRGFRDHVELEEGSIKRANEILDNVWIRENKAVSELIQNLRDDEKGHTEALTRLSAKTFFRLDSGDFIVIMRGQNSQRRGIDVQETLGGGTLSFVVEYART